MIKHKLYLCYLLFTLSISSAFAISFPYGKSGNIDYNLSTGTFNVKINTNQFITSAFASAKVNNQELNSKNYQKRVYSKVSIKNQFGAGTKHTITLTAAGLPVLKQVFYTYNNLSYFFTEVEIEGKDLSSNDITPINGSFTLLNNKELRSLFIPFDNDTFIWYNTKVLSTGEKQTSAEAGVLYDATTQQGLIAGSVEQENWKTGVLSSSIDKSTANLKVQVGFTEEKITRDVIPHGFLKGNKITSPKIFVGWFADWRAGMNDYAISARKAEALTVQKWNKPTPVGWNSWGVMQEKINYEKSTKVVDFFVDSLSAFRNDNVAFIDLDSYWDNMLKSGLEGDYSKLKAFADYTKKHGLKPGIYWAPFTDWGYKDGDNRRVEGGDFTYKELWTKTGNGYHDLDGARALDPTHPGTQKRIALVINKLKECGFEMIKIDFLGHAAVESSQFYDKNITTGMQAYKVGMDYLLKQLDNKMLIYAAISPSLASKAYVNVRRIACDAFHSINDTKYTLNSVTYGWWQTHLYDYVDGDHLVLAKDTKGANFARALSGFVTGTVILGDDFSQPGPWAVSSKTIFQNKDLLQIIKDGKAFTPIESHLDASNVFVKEINNTKYLAIFNYNDKDLEIDIPAEKIGLKDYNQYQIKRIFGADAVLENGHTKMPPATASLFQLIKN